MFLLLGSVGCTCKVRLTNLVFVCVRERVGQSRNSFGPKILSKKLGSPSSLVTSSLPLTWCFLTVRQRQKTGQKGVKSLTPSRPLLSFFLTHTVKPAHSFFSFLLPGYLVVVACCCCYPIYSTHHHPFIVTTRISTSSSTSSRTKQEGRLHNPDSLLLTQQQ